MKDSAGHEYIKELRELLVGQVFEHWKGSKYEVVDVVILESSLEPLIIYEGREGERWARPKSNFFSLWGYDEKKLAPIMRFTPVKPRLAKDAKVTYGDVNVSTEEIKRAIDEVAVEIRRAFETVAKDESE